MKNGSIIAIISIHITSHTTTITRGSMVVCIFFTILSISLFVLLLNLNNKSAKFQVSSHIFTTLDNSIGK
ncbi:MAG: hypothetical protein P1U46_04120 [Patescibacteria group bacterium]|nr:hypothetical protein [Patescibacteria group bacterium]